MGAFELRKDKDDCPDEGAIDDRKMKEECIIAKKVYDSCRQQDCLTVDELGPARAAECKKIGDETIREGDVIDPPSNAAAVTIDQLKVKRIIIVSKVPSPFRKGFWDIDIKYVFEYRLTFREADGCVIDSIMANSIFNKRVSLFGSEGTELTIASDLFGKYGTETLDAEPFILVEAKAVALAAELKFQKRMNMGLEDLSPSPNAVHVTIGLFTIIKLFRIVNLTVMSKGFCIPRECDDISPSNPCDFFDSLDFPMDVFAPPQKPEFFAGVSGDIPNKRKHKDEDCGCGE